MNNLKNLLFHDRIHSQWLILAIDLLTILSSLFFSSSLSGKFTYTAYDLYYIMIYIMTVVSTFVIMGIHTRIIRYADTKDMLRIVLAIIFANMAFVFAGYLLFIPILKLNAKIAWETLVINVFISTSLLMISRVIIKNLFLYVEQTGLKQNQADLKQNKENVLIYGSGQSSLLVKRAIEAHKQLLIHVCAFIDSDADKINKCLEQTRVYPLNSLKALKERFSVSRLLVTYEELNLNGKKQILQQCIELGIKVTTVPPASEWLNGQPNIRQFQDLKIEDLLGRKPIKLVSDHILNELTGKRILVTGAAGSIGAEIVRQVLRYDPELIILCDQAETPLHDMQLELTDKAYIDKTKIFIADVQNPGRIETLFSRYHPQIVFHAAAYKHVPMMENNPAEAVLTNVGGTRILADISIRYGVEKFIMISTDKAVRPTNVMGASKRIAEMYIQSLNHIAAGFNSEDIDLSFINTKFITTRFGNVLGSNGSVIPRFKAQIEKGGPVTVTHPEITRYFMTIPEAVHLVLEAAVMGNGGEIFLFEMGKPVKIADLAANMIRLAGLIPEKDIEIIFTGLRPGEKLHEELLNQEEKALPTYNKDIMVSTTIPCCYDEIKVVITDLLQLCLLDMPDRIVAKMKELLPDFVSNNSEFEKLDNELVHHLQK